MYRVLLPLVAGEMVRAGRAQCKLYSIPCEDGAGCYSFDHLCNGVRDCADGTDEKGCAMTTATSPQSVNPTVCSTGVTCLDYEERSICLTDTDMCNGVRQCREGFDEASCPPHPNPYVLPALVSLAAVLIIMAIMCAVYRLCLYRYSSSRVNTHRSTSCSTVFLKKHGSEVRMEIPQLELSDKDSCASSEGYLPAAREQYEPAAREQYVQYPSGEEEAGEGSSVDSSSSQWVSTTI